MRVGDDDVPASNSAVDVRQRAVAASVGDALSWVGRSSVPIVQLRLRRSPIDRRAAALPCAPDHHPGVAGCCCSQLAKSLVARLLSVQLQTKSI